ncbi:hypothetical protein [Xanthomonas arboricola]|uniref:hypothetical protein n=1 Tax=Xanthomonas arboricola TaxID=56448 RepID=UPI0011AF302A|nr:hypothetical protein [Xanthomonas arboricola]
MLDPVHVLRGEAQTPLRRPDVLPQVDVTLGRGRREQALADDGHAVTVAVQRKRTLRALRRPNDSLRPDGYRDQVRHLACRNARITYQPTAC